MTFRADLHVHSTFSDGTDTPKQLIDLAINAGLSALSITDHDTVAGYSEALPYAQEKNFPLLTGVEFSSTHHNFPVHVLGYGIDLKSAALDALCQRHRTRRHNRNLAILERLRGMGIKIDESELEGHTVGRPHIAKLLINRGIVGSIKEAFDRYLGEEKRAYVAGEPIPVEHTIDVIHEAGGKAVIAHPHLIKRRPVVRQLLEMPFDGIEGYYARFAPAQEKQWVEMGEKKGWIITGGSDYHGDNKPFNHLGSSWVSKETFDALAA